MRPFPSGNLCFIVLHCSQLNFLKLESRLYACSGAVSLNSFVCIHHSALFTITVWLMYYLNVNAELAVSTVLHSRDPPEELFHQSHHPHDGH